MRIPTILAAACLLLVSCQQEEGCTDAAATNYDPNAVEDDGSCEYDNDPGSPGGGGSLDEPTIDGYTYDVVTIGEQIWFAENLRTTVYANGDPIPFSLMNDEWVSTNEGATAVYGEGSSFCHDFSPDIDACDEAQSLAEYGRLYNWYAVDDARGLCPIGWHVPTEEEWTELEDYISSQGFGGDEGIALRSTYGWSVDEDLANSIGTDDYGFSALPGGYRNTIFSGVSSGAFYYAGQQGCWWSSSPVNGGAFSIWLYYDDYNVDHDTNDPRDGFSVRCLRDAE